MDLWIERVVVGRTKRRDGLVHSRQRSLPVHPCQAMTSRGIEGVQVLPDWIRVLLAADTRRQDGLQIGRRPVGIP